MCLLSVHVCLKQLRRRCELLEQPSSRIIRGIHASIHPSIDSTFHASLYPLRSAIAALELVPHQPAPNTRSSCIIVEALNGRTMP